MPASTKWWITFFYHLKQILGTKSICTLLSKIYSKVWEDKLQNI